MSDVVKAMVISVVVSTVINVVAHFITCAIVRRQAREIAQSHFGREFHAE